MNNPSIKFEVRHSLSHGKDAYFVVQARNTLVRGVGDILTKVEVQELIDLGFDVTVVGPK